jgi:uncharacterized membrane protein
MKRGWLANDVSGSRVAPSERVRYRADGQDDPAKEARKVELEVVVDVDASPERVWTIMSDVERWPEWTASIRSVRLLEDRPFGVGSTARVKQPRFPPATWRVTRFEPGVEFVWESKSPGAYTVGEHRVAPHGNGSRATLAIRQSGPLMALMMPFTRGITRRYVDMEAAGLKERAEESERRA